MREQEVLALQVLRYQVPSPAAHPGVVSQALVQQAAKPLLLLRALLGIRTGTYCFITRFTLQNICTIIRLLTRSS